jgi:hypothetical protein
MDSLNENSILKTLQDIFQSYLTSSSETVNKRVIIQLFFDYNIIDTCGYDIFQISSFLDQLNPTNDEMTLKHFLTLVFYIYSKQTQNNVNTLNSEGKEDLNVLSLQNINELSENRKTINSTYNIVNIMINQKDKLETYFYFEIPNFDETDISKLISHDELSFIEKYKQNIYDNIFIKYAQTDHDKHLPFINIIYMNHLLFELPFFVNFTSDELALYFRNFIQVKLENEEDEAIYHTLFERKMNHKEVTEVFNHFLTTTNDVNFNYSAFVIIISYFALHLKASEHLDFEEKIKFFFETQLNITTDDATRKTLEQINENVKMEEIEDYLPESDMLNKAKLRENNKKADVDFLDEFLSLMDKNLPEEDEYMKAFSNDIPSHSNNLYSNPYKVVPAKFPVERLDVEVQEEKERQIEAKEKAAIKKAAKPKKQQKDKNQNPLEFSMKEVPNEHISNIRNYGKPRIETLTNRLLKQTIKEILPNSNVYPSLIKEVLMLPNSFQTKTIELIVESYKDQVSGHLEKAILRLEKAKDTLTKENKSDNQVNLFFNLSFGSLYETLDYDVVALRYYYDAKSFSDKLPLSDPDCALVYCYMGEMFIKLKELSWAMRCYLQAKRIRESTIGGDTPDTATVYNNLGVVAYYMQSYLPANGYFKLAYEIYKSTMGLTHPRTLMIQSNLTKMKQLNFNKEIEFKTLAKYPTPAQVMANKKKKGKK